MEHHLVDTLAGYGLVEEDVTAFVHPSVSLTPEQRLCIAVLDDSIARLRLYMGLPLKTAERIEEYEWIMSDDSSSAMAFVSICHSVQVDPDYLRRVINQRLKDPAMVQRRGRLYHKRSR